MNAGYREARPDDIPACADLFLESLSDMRARHNFASSALPPRSEMQAFYEHVLATGVFRIAEIDGRIAALACAILRDHLWFLSGFWARPELQRRGIGMPLLRSVWEAGRSAGARIFFVWASIDVTAMASYMKLGMLPGCEMLTFQGGPRLLTADISGYAVSVLDMGFAMDMDQATLGTRRKVDHDFWSGTGFQGRQVFCNGESIGYYYYHGETIGPAAWKEPQHAEALLTLACREAAKTKLQVQLEIPGINHTALRFALDCGLRLTVQSHFLTSARFGGLHQYLPSGPGLF